MLKGVDTAILITCILHKSRDEIIITCIEHSDALLSLKRTGDSLVMEMKRERMMLVDTQVRQLLRANKEDVNDNRQAGDNQSSNMLRVISLRW